MLVLRHERWLPAGATPLVEKIGERVLVLPGVSRELHYDSLVFFHRTIEIMTVTTLST